MKMKFFIIVLLVVSELSFAQKNREEELTLKSKPSNLYGTLLVPEAYSSTVILIVPGSGPTDRDGNSNILKGNNNSLKYLAENLATNGFASLRIDKRGVGKSLNAMTREEDLRFETYVNDVIDWGFNLLNDIRFKELIIIGHSEGALIGMIATKELELKAYVSLAGTSLTADSIISKQMAQQPQEIKTAVEKVFKELRKGNTVENINSDLAMLFRISVQPYMISWMKYNPTKEIANLTVPSLIVQGTTDIQISPEEAKMLHQANKKSELVIIDNMNHVLKEVSTEREANIASYSDPELKNHNQLIKELTKFFNSLD